MRTSTEDQLIGERVVHNVKPAFIFEKVYNDFVG